MADNGIVSRVLIISSVMLVSLNTETASAFRSVKKIPNNIVDVKTECSLTDMNVTLVLEREFQGVVFARDFALQCRAVGSREKTVTLHLTASGCGVRITPSKLGGLTYSVVVEIQMARHLRQVSDPSKAVSCQLPSEKMVLHSPALPLDKSHSSGRTGRMMGKGGQVTEENAKAWLEIEGSAISQYEEGNAVSVGEHTTLLVKTWLPDNIGTRVVDCLAHDGLGETSQLLSDSVGCPVDELIFPRFRSSVNNSKSYNGYRLIVQAASFPAFKFPDRDTVHIRCGLQLCRGECQSVNCSTDTHLYQNTSRNERKFKGEEGEVLDYIQLFNSVEVLAPGIEMDNLNRANHFHNSDGPSPSNLVTDDFGYRPLCLATSRIGLAFVTLGVIYLAAIVVALCYVLRNCLYRYVNSDRIRDNSSFYIGSRSRSSMSAWSYGRIQ